MRENCTSGSARGAPGNWRPYRTATYRRKRRIHVNGNGIKMGKNRLEAFSDGVLAIIITIMVLGNEGPARRHRCRYRCLWCRASELCAQFRLRRHLLE